MCWHWQVGDDNYEVVEGSQFSVSRTAFKDNSSYYKVTYTYACSIFFVGLCLNSASEMTYIVSRGALNSTHSLTVFERGTRLCVIIAVNVECCHTFSHMHSINQ